MRMRGSVWMPYWIVLPSRRPNKLHWIYWRKQWKNDGRFYQKNNAKAFEDLLSHVTTDHTSINYYPLPCHLYANMVDMLCVGVIKMSSDPTVLKTNASLVKKLDQVLVQVRILFISPFCLSTLSLSFAFLPTSFFLLGDGTRTHSPIQLQLRCIASIATDHSNQHVVMV